MAERDDDERRDRNQRAVAAAAGAAIVGIMAGPAGAIAGAALGSMLEPLVMGIWAEFSESARRRQVDVLISAVHAGIPVDEMQERIDASERTQLLADDNAKIDTEQMIIAAIADIEGPQLAMLELLVAWRPGRHTGEPLISGPLDLPEDSHCRPIDDNWDIAWREWPRELIALARLNLAPLAPSLLGTVQRHGLVAQDTRTGEAIENYAREFEKKLGEQYAREGRAGAFRPSGAPKVRNPAALAPEPHVVADRARRAGLPPLPRRRGATRRCVDFRASRAAGHKPQDSLGACD